MAAVTATQGRYRFGAVPVGRYTLEVQYVEFATSSESVEIVGRPVALDVEMADSGGSLQAGSPDASAVAAFGVERLDDPLG